MEVSSVPRQRGGLALHAPPRFLARMSDDRLVEQIRRGNEAAFEVVYDRHHRGILGFCRHMLRSQEEAEDAVQHTFISAHSDLVGSDKPIRLKAWLYTIARNRCLSMLRARREQAELPEELPTAGLTDAVVEREDLRRLLADVHSLPEDQRAALVLSELGGLSHAEIAGVVGCEAVKVKALVFQARSSLLESKRASELSCQEIREELATARGGALRRGPLRRHVRSCQGCAEFREQVVSQRRMLALALPVVPTLGLKHAVLASVGGGHAAAAGGAALGGGALGGGAAGSSGVAATAGGAASAGGVGAAAGGGGGLLSAIGAAGAAKIAVIAVVAAGGSALAVEQGTKHQPADSKSESGGKGGAWVDTDGDGKPDTPAGAAAAREANGKAGGSATAATARERAAQKKVAAEARAKERRLAANGHHGDAQGRSAGHRKDGKTSKTDDETTTTTDDTAPGYSGAHPNNGNHGGGGSSGSDGGSTSPPAHSNGSPPATHPPHPVHPPPPPQSQGHATVPPSKIE